MTPGGFAGKILRADLSNGDIRTDPLDARLAERFLGGLGLCVRLAWDALTPGADALSPENPVVIGAGPLVGTSVPASSRVYAVTKLPAGGTVGWCGGGGMRFGCSMKYAGFDNIVITGAASSPVYLYIEDGTAQIRDARGLWGLDVNDATGELWKEHGPDAGVIAIGRSGETLVSFSMAFVDRTATLGRGGFGAVMGSKRLKAVVCRGTGGLTAADHGAFIAHVNRLQNEIRDYPYLQEWQELGLLKSLAALPRETYLNIRKRRIACVSCPLGDKDMLEIADGPHQGLSACTSSVVNMLTPMIYGIKDYRDSIKLSAALDDYGMDSFEFFGVMGFARRLVDAGFVYSGQASPPIDLSSLRSMEVWARRVALREGLGDILAGGSAGIIAAFRDDARHRAPAVVKGMQPYVGPGAPLPWDLMGTMELGQLLDPRGPHVGAGGSPTYFAKRPLDVFPKHLSRMGVPQEALARILPEGGLNVGRLLMYSHRWFSILGSLGICARAQVNRFYSASRCAALYGAVTGFPADTGTLARGADRAWTLLRMINVREGITRREDSPPEAWFDGPGFKNYLTDERISRESLEEMIGDYYDEQGWDRETGVPTKERLRELGLKECL